MSTALMYFIGGTMFGGKSSRLVDVLEMAKDKGLPHMALKPARDTRDGGKIKTHTGKSYPAKLVSTVLSERNRAMLLDWLERTKDEVRVLVIDEVQFFSLEFSVWLYETLREYGDNLTLVVGGLDRTATDKPFGSGPFWRSYADRREWHACQCFRCGQTAELSFYKGSGEAGPGGAEAYESLCRTHWVEAMKEKREQEAVLAAMKDEKRRERILRATSD